MSLIIGDLLAISILAAIIFAGFKILPIELFIILAFVALCSLIFMIITIFPTIIIAMSSIAIFEISITTQIAAVILGSIAFKNTLPYIINKIFPTTQLHNNNGIKKNIINIVEFILCISIVSCIIFFIPSTLSAIASHIIIFLGITNIVTLIIDNILQHMQSTAVKKENTEPIIDKNELESYQNDEIQPEENTAKINDDKSTTEEQINNEQKTNSENLNNKQEEISQEIPQEKISNSKSNNSINKENISLAL